MIESNVKIEAKYKQQKKGEIHFDTYEIDHEKLFMGTYSDWMHIYFWYNSIQFKQKAYTVHESDIIAFCTVFLVYLFLFSIAIRILLYSINIHIQYTNRWMPPKIEIHYLFCFRVIFCCLPFSILTNGIQTSKH